MSKKYLITGASGFVGANLTRKLVAKGCDVVLVLRKDSNTWRILDLLPYVKIIKADLTNLKKIRIGLSKYKPDIIYHLATYGAYSYQNDADKILKTNLFGTWNLLKACSDLDYELFVNISSSSEYGFKEKAMKETDLLEPNSYYAVSKVSQTLLSNFYAVNEKRPIVTLRLFSVYGPYEQPGRLVPTLLKSLFRTLPMDVVDKEIARDFIYVGDVVNLLLKVDQLKKYPGECFNLGSGKQTTIGNIINKSIAVTKRNTKFNWGKMKSRSWDNKTWVADMTKTHELLKWKTKTDLDEGIEKTWKWIIKNINYYE